MSVEILKICVLHGCPVAMLRWCLLTCPGVINYFVQLCNEVNNTIAVKKTITKKNCLLFAVIWLVKHVVVVATCEELECINLLLERLNVLKWFFMRKMSTRSIFEFYLLNCVLRLLPARHWNSTEKTVGKKTLYIECIASSSLWCHIKSLVTSVHAKSFNL